MCFPEENYVYDDLKKSNTIIGAYCDDKCVGLAIIQKSIYKYMYLYDLKVLKSYCSMGIGSNLIKVAKQISKSLGFNGVYTIGQDNNVIACLFYIKNGFVIGGLDTIIYKGTKQEGKSDIIFYLD